MNGTEALAITVAVCVIGAAALVWLVKNVR